MVDVAGEAPFDALVHDHAGAVHRYLRRRLVGAADPSRDADDLTAEVFVVAWRRRDDLPEPALPWLYGVARRLLANERRRRVDTPIDPWDMAEASDEVVAAADPGELVVDDAALVEAWSTLGPRDREILALVAWEGLDGEGLAVALGIGVGGAGAALSRARARLAAAIDAASDGG